MIVKKILVVMAAFAAMMLSASAQSGAVSPYSSEGIRETYVKKEVMIRMRDGVELFTAVYEPKDRSERHPVMMLRTCYRAAPYGEDNYASFYEYAPYVDAGYIFVFQDVRGKNKSGGDFEEIRPFKEGKVRHRKEARNIGQTDEASDTYDTIDWIVANTFNNGCVGQMGISYPGFYATMGALSGHPALKAVSPQAPVSNWYKGDDVHHNGAFMLAETVSFQPWFEYMASNRTMQKGLTDKDFKFPDIRGNDVYTDFLRIGTYSNITAAYGDSLSYLRTVREHPDWDEYWISHTVTEGHMHDVRPAVMIVGGLFDKEDCYGALDTYKAIKAQSPQTELYLVEGPWYHGGWRRHPSPAWANMYFGEDVTSSSFINEIEYPFFAYYLEGKGEKPAAEARVYDSGTRRWCEFKDGWPLVGIQDAAPFYLLADGTLSCRKPDDDKVTTYVSDPANPVPYNGTIDQKIDLNYMIADQRFAGMRPDVVTFVSEPLSEPMTLAGEIEAELMVDISTTDADFIVKVIDVFPSGFSWREELGLSRDEYSALGMPRYEMGGYQLLVRGEVMRGRYRESFSAPVPFEPGKSEAVRFSMPDVSHTFKPGHRIMVQVQSTWFPLVDRNPQTFCDIYTSDESAYKPCTVNIHSSSCVKLPVVR